MSRNETDNKPGAVEFETINREIDLLMKRLHGKKICPCCVAQGMMYRGAFLHREVAGAEDTIALCMDVADSIKHPDGMPESNTQH